MGTASPALANLRAVGIMAHRATAGAARRVVSGVFAPARWLANVPTRDDVATRDDVQRVSRQVATLTSEVRALAAAQHEPSATVQAAGSRAARGRRVAESSAPKAQDSTAAADRQPVSGPPKSRRRPG